VAKQEQHDWYAEHRAYEVSDRDTRQCTKVSRRPDERSRYEAEQDTREEKRFSAFGSEKNGEA
jgi:hypothetical protein